MIVKRLVSKKQVLKCFLKSLNVSEKVIDKLTIENRISLNGEVLTIDSLLKENDVIDIDLNNFEKNDIVHFEKQIEVVYEDDDIILVNKKKGILIHDDGNTSNTLLNAVSYYLSRKNENCKIRALHRIDLETTGLVLFAKNILSYYYLDKQIEEGEVNKYYLAVVSGKINEKRGVIDLNIGKDRHHNNRYVVCRSGKKAITSYTVEKVYSDRTLVMAKILTGRTHQIRVHFAYLKHPIIGDEIYGAKDEKNGLMLHAFRLGFKHPKTQKYVEYEVLAPWKMH